MHFTPKKALARELGVSVGSIRDWAIYIQHGFFDWIDNPWVEVVWIFWTYIRVQTMQCGHVLHKMLFTKIDRKLRCI